MNGCLGIGDVAGGDGEQIANWNEVDAGTWGWRQSGNWLGRVDDVFGDCDLFWEVEGSK